MSDAAIEFAPQANQVVDSLVKLAKYVFERSPELTDDDHALHVAFGAEVMSKEQLGVIIGIAAVRLARMEVKGADRV
jgi:hypothetical protein